MADLCEIVSELSREFKKREPIIPCSEALKDDLYTMSGIDKSEPHAFLLIPIDSIHLQHLGSACGNCGNKVFSDKSLMSFLKNRNVGYMVGILDEPDFHFSFDYGSIGLNSIAIPLVGKDGHIFQRIVGKLGGSFRYERSQVPGWSVYESE